MPSASHFDVAIIGAGMSALSAGIRLAHFGKKVCLFERHNAVGGLNSFYSIAGRKFDVGLHALTNYVPREVKGTPLGKIIRQLRLDRDALDLCPQRRSAVRFPGVELAFTNDFAVLESEVARAFPAQIDGFRRLAADIRGFDDNTFTPPAFTARDMIRRHIAEPLLEEMVLCPVMYYGSATEHDMDALQFVIMFKSLFFEGFARPFDGIRPVLRLLNDRLRESGGQRRMKCGVKRILTGAGRVTALELDDGETVTADFVLSSAGGVETRQLYGEPPSPAQAARTGRLSFVETIQVLKNQPRDFGWGDTIVFFNDSPRFDYARCEDRLVDVRSGVICCPNNFEYGERQLAEGFVRTTCIANFDRWAALPEAEYATEKARWFPQVAASARRFLQPVADATLAAATVTTDMFTPTTVRKFTGHLGGAVYGSPEKIRDGRTPFANLFLIGTDQGYLGVVGSMLSGITIANLHVLKAGG